MLVSTLFVMLFSSTDSGAASSEPRNACTTPLLSYTYDATQSDGRTMVTCFVCTDVVTWRLVDHTGNKRVISRRSEDIDHLRGAIEQIQMGNIVQSRGSAHDASTAFYWAHPSDAPKFLLSARQQDHIWTNDASSTDTLMDVIDTACSDPM